MKIPAFFILSVLITVFPVYSQETFDIFIPAPQPVSLAPEFPEDVPRQFRDLFLGMGLDDLKLALQRDSLFAFRGDRDVSFIPIREETLIETTGMSFIRRAFFQLTEGRVFIMAFSLNPRLVDHYSIYTSLVRKYGEPDLLNPTEAVWESGDTRLSIERPLTVKYMDRRTFNSLIEESRTMESYRTYLREEFLREF